MIFNFFIYPLSETLFMDVANATGTITWGDFCTRLLPTETAFGGMGFEGVE
jgi:hypothetical protein